MATVLDDFGRFFQDTRYDLLIILGDRYEIYTLTIAAAMQRIPIVHLHGGEVTLDSLWAESDALADQGLDERSEEYNELREKIRQFAEDHNYDIRISHSKNNEQLLQELDTLVKEVPAHTEEAENAKEEEKPAPSRRSHRPTEEDDNDENDGEVDNNPAAPAPEPEVPVQEAAPVRRRRR